MGNIFVMFKLSKVTPKSMKPHAFSNIKSLFAMMDENENIELTIEEILPAFSNRCFRIG